LNNGIGQRVRKVEGGTTYNYTLNDDGIDAPVLDDGSASYTHGLGLVSENRSGTSKYLHSDALGTTRAWSNSSGTKTDSLDTDAFGMVVSSSGSTPKPFGFAGQHGYQSDATGLQRLGHRYYDASTGRFISRDPIRDGYNWYGYCENDPVNSVDPEGLNPGAIAIGIGIGGGAAVGGAVLITGAVLLVAVVVIVLADEARRNLPLTGPPNGSDVIDNGNGKGQIRDYAPDGYPLKDIDFGHDHGAGDPHVHDWTRPPDGSPPTHDDRQRGRPLEDGD
jgi:RHS repeat-associated protein